MSGTRTLTINATDLRVGDFVQADPYADGTGGGVFKIKWLVPGPGGRMSAYSEGCQQQVHTAFEDAVTIERPTAWTKTKGHILSAARGPLMLRHPRRWAKETRELYPAGLRALVGVSILSGIGITAAMHPPAIGS